MFNEPDKELGRPGHRFVRHAALRHYITGWVNYFKQADMMNTDVSAGYY